MKSYRKELWFTVPTRRAFINITPDVRECLRESGIQEGLCLVMATGRFALAPYLCHNLPYGLSTHLHGQTTVCRPARGPADGVLRGDKKRDVKRDMKEVVAMGLKRGAPNALASDYQLVTQTIVDELCCVVGERHVVYGVPERMLDYAHDEVAGEEYAHLPEVVVKPATAAEISEIVRLANRERVPVTPRGAGSGLSCGAVPVYGGVLLSLERMNHILEIDAGNMVVVVEPGVVTNAINEAVEPLGLFYAGYPMSLETCFIGGNVAENAGGGRAIKYGVTGRNNRYR